jgi:hypothetical protein
VRLPDPRLAELDVIALRVADAVRRDEPLGPIAITFLLRHYLATGRDDLADAVGIALAVALPRSAAADDTASRAAWLTLFTDAAALSDDERLTLAAADLLVALRRAWPSTADLADAAASLDACLRAGDVPGLADAQELVPAVIDELERVVGRAYQPGAGVGPSPAAHVRTAAALLTAFERSGRLPYSMLAEELIQPLRRDAPADDVVVACGAVQVLCRLAVLHASDEYRTAAVIAADADYGADADRILSALAARAIGADFETSAAYGLAAGEWLAFRGR